MRREQLEVALHGLVEGAVPTWAHDQPCLDVPPAAWSGAAVLVRDRLGYACFDWLSAVDEGAQCAVVLCVADWSCPGAVDYLLVRTRLDADALRLPSLVPVFRGADWHERETHEMFGIDFDGHPALAPLLLPDGFEGHPLRKEFVLASRAAVPWPGATEPGESAADAQRPRTGRRRTVAPGLPDPAWGPRAPEPSGTR